jgi:hypothetical protein
MTATLEYSLEQVGNERQQGGPLALPLVITDFQVVTGKQVN